MRVSISASGGFVGLRRTKVVDTDSLAPEDAAAVHRAVFELGEAPPGERHGSEPAYDIEVEDAGTSRRFSVFETGLPIALRALVASAPEPPDPTDSK